ncbi:hypothetical protein [Streptomyces sp. NPDC005548]|uniref:hypothetical protein n=1 Tax=Streptomyces sp. NPDC005548 TaxID=3364724 RepID=UPI0036C064F8
MRDRLLTAAQKLEDAGALEEAADVRAVAAPGGWTLLRVKDSAEASAGAPLPLTIDRTLREQLKEKADDLGVLLGAVVTDGFQKVLDGSWTPPQLARATAPDKVVLNLRVNKDLMDQVQAQTARLSQKHGYRITKSSIAIAWLAEDLGVDIAIVDTEQAG